MWQPIETAPKDGTKVDLWAGGSRFTDCRWGRHDEESRAPWGEPHWRGVPFYRQHGIERQLPVTHWMLPPAMTDGPELLDLSKHRERMVRALLDRHFQNALTHFPDGRGNEAVVRAEVEAYRPIAEADVDAILAALRN